MTTTLVPCPLCGAEKGYTLIDYYRISSVACQACGQAVAEFMAALPTSEDAFIAAAPAAWNSAGAHAQGLRDEIARLRSALNAMLTQFGMDEDEWSKPTFNQARAALAKAPK